MTTSSIAWLLSPGYGYLCLGVLATLAEHQTILTDEVASPMGLNPEELEQSLVELRNRGLVTEPVHGTSVRGGYIITPLGRLILHQLLESCLSN